MCVGELWVAGMDDMHVCDWAPNDDAICNMFWTDDFAVHAQHTIYSAHLCAKVSFACLPLTGSCGRIYGVVNFRYPAYIRVI